MKNLKKIVFGLLAMLVMVTSVSAANIKYTKLSELNADQREISNNGTSTVYKLLEGFINLEVDIDNAIVNFNSDNVSVYNVLVSAKNVEFTDGDATLTNVPTNIVITGSLNLNGKLALDNTKATIVNKGELTINGQDFKSLTNEKNGKLAINSAVSNLTINGGEVTVTSDGRIDGSASVMNDGKLTVDLGVSNANITVKGGTAISYATGLKNNYEDTGNGTPMVSLKATDEEEHEIYLVVPVAEVTFDVKILDKEGNEVSGSVKEGERYIVTPVIMWNGMEVTSKGAGTSGYASLIEDTMPITIKSADETILVKYTGADRKANEYIALANGVAKFELTVTVPTGASLFDDEEALVLTKTADSEHSTVKPAEDQKPSDEPSTDEPSTDEPVVDPGNDGEPAGDETEGKVPSTFDGIASIVTMAISSVSAAGYSIKKIIRK